MHEKEHLAVPTIPIGENGEGNLNLYNGDLVFENKEVSLSQTEAGVLALVVSDEDPHTSYEKINNMFWADWPTEECQTALWVTVSRLRSKLKKVGLEKCFVTLSHVGYGWDIDKR